MLEGAEEAEAAEASLEPRRNWGPVCGEQTDAIGAAAAVATGVYESHPLEIRRQGLSVITPIFYLLDSKFVFHENESDRHGLTFGTH